MPSRATRRALPLLSLTMLLLIAPAASSAQTFTRITDPTNPVVTDAGAPGYSGASWIDVDRDGLLDLFVGDRGIYHNLGGGVFANIPISGFFETLGNSWADIDNDGDNDLIVAGNDGGRGTRIYRNDGLTFRSITATALGDSLANAGWACAWGDYDGDGLVDLVIANTAGTTGSNGNHLFHNLGNGAFLADLSTDVTTGTSTFTVPTWCDFDQDGDLDLSISAGQIGIGGVDYFYRNQRVEGGTPLLKRITTGALATDVHDGQLINWIDCDNDGDFDCYITNYLYVQNMLYRNDGGTFVLVPATAGPIVTDPQINEASVWEDFDNDGDLDCYVTKPAGANRYYRNEGNGTFTSVDIGEPVTIPSITATAGDYDNDGDVDLYASSSGPLHGLFRNDLANGNHWLEVDLTGTTSNRSAIGTRVRVHAMIGGKDVWQLREVSAQNTFNGQSSLIQHFGLGDATQILQLRIEWPRGLIETMADVPVDTCLRLIEGDIGTPVTIALAGTRVTDRGVELTWDSPELGTRAGLAVQRRASQGEWASLGAPTVESGERIVYLDAGVPAGRWDYRLAVPDAGGSWFTPDVWVDVPSLRLSVRALAGRGGDPLRIAYTLPEAGAVDVRLFDATGRVRAHSALGERPAGAGTADMQAGTLRAGVYWVRLGQRGRAATARVTVHP